jgi:hypothetical protein
MLPSTSLCAAGRSHELTARRAPSGILGCPPEPRLACSQPPPGCRARARAGAGERDAAAERRAQGLYLLYVYPTSRRADALFWLGAGAWALGWAVNLHSDALLRGLRRPGETGYRIPVGGAFKYVSAANYFGEIVEWAGFALAARSLPAAAFAAFTFANLGPRGAAHHAWYIQRFKDYPRRRRAVLPFLW